MIEKTYSILEAVQLLGISKQNINKAILDGRLSAFRSRDLSPWRITKRAIDSFLENRRVTLMVKDANEKNKKTETEF